MVQTWMTDITPLYDEACYQRYYQTLPKFRQEKADRMAYQSGKAQSAGAWVLLESIRKKYGITEKAAFNLSHSGDYVLCSVDMNAREGTLLGCDIEAVKEANLKVAKRFFCPSEYEEIMRQGSAKMQSEVFYRFWVLKESFLKATREGMALDLQSFEIRLGTPPILLTQPKAYPQKYHYQEYTLPNVPYKMAVCSTEDVIDLKIQTEFKLG